MDIRRIKLTKEEQKIEDAIEEYVTASKAKFKKVARALAHHCKDVALHRQGTTKIFKYHNVHNMVQ